MIGTAFFTLIALVAIVAASLLIALAIGLGASGRQAIPFFALRVVRLGLIIYLVPAPLAVTTQYLFSTLRRTFPAVPNPPTVLLA